MKITKKTIRVKASELEVSVSLPPDAELDEILRAMEGIIKALGYCPRGELDYIETEERP